MATSMNNLTVPVTPEIRQELDRIAATVGGSPEGLAAEAIRAYLEEYHRHAAIIAERLERDLSGKATYIDHDTAMAKVEMLLKQSHQ